MANKIWTHLKLKNGDTVQFAPPAPNGDLLGGITAAEKSKFNSTAASIAEPYDSTKTYEDGDFAMFDGELRKMVSGEWQTITIMDSIDGLIGEIESALEAI